MKQFSFFKLSVAVSLAVVAWSTHAQRPTPKVTDIPADTETSIVIKKGDVSKACERYEIVQDTAEVVGDPSPDRKAARQSWKASCEAWKKELRELNTAPSSVLAMDCGKPTESKENYQFVYSSNGRYKLKIRTESSAK